MPSVAPFQKVSTLWTDEGLATRRMSQGTDGTGSSQLGGSESRDGNTIGETGRFRSVGLRMLR